MFSGLHTTGKKYKDIDRSTGAQSVTTMCHYDDGKVLPARKIELDLTVRVLNKDYICVVVNPNDFLKERVIAHGAASIKDIEENGIVAYKYIETIRNRMQQIHYIYLPQMVESMREASHWKVNADTPTTYGMWHQRIDDYNVYPITDWGHLLTTSRDSSFDNYEDSWMDSTGMSTYMVGELAFYCYIKMPSSMVDGTTYDILDKYGNHMPFTYNDEDSISWSIRVNQLGYIGSANKFGYLGMWMGPDLGGLDFSGYSGNTFHLRRVSDDVSVYNSTIAYRMDDPIRLEDQGETDEVSSSHVLFTGEYKQYEMDFSSYTTTGEFYLQIDDIGKSWPFKIDSAANVYGPLFYHTSRALYHQRGQSDFTSSTTNFVHSTKYRSFKTGGVTGEDLIILCKVAGLPDGEDEQSGSGDAWDGDGSTWGWYNETTSSWITSGIPTAGNAREAYVTDWGALSEWDATITGGFHDAADMDRRPMHLNCTYNLAIAYLMYPSNFTDDQLDIPESGDTIPDMLSNAEWGIKWIKAIQDKLTTGAVSITAETYPVHQGHKFVIGDPTRLSTYEYAFSASVLGKALLVAGETTLGNTYVTSAEEAWDWCEATSPQTMSTCAGTYGGDKIHFVEPPDSNEFVKRARLFAAVGLRIATEETEYLTALTDIGTTFFEDNVETSASGHYAYSVQSGAAGRSDVLIKASLISLYTSLMPTGWGTTIDDRVALVADGYSDTMSPANMYRETWQDGSDYWDSGAGVWKTNGSAFESGAWGVRGTGNMAILFVAYKLLGTQKYLDTALYGMDYYLGCNSQGQSLFSGIGSSSIYRWLLKAGTNQMHGEWPRGYTLYHNEFSVTGSWFGDGSNHAMSVFRMKTGVARDSGFTDHGVRFEKFMMPKPYENYTARGDVNDYIPYVYSDHPTWGASERNSRLFRHLLPWYKRRHLNYGQAVRQNEYTVFQNMAPAIFCTACVMGTGWSPDATEETGWTARTEQEMYNSKFLQP